MWFFCIIVLCIVACRMLNYIDKLTAKVVKVEEQMEDVGKALKKIDCRCSSKPFSQPR